MSHIGYIAYSEAVAIYIHKYNERIDFRIIVVVLCTFINELLLRSLKCTQKRIVFCLSKRVLKLSSCIFGKYYLSTA